MDWLHLHLSLSNISITPPDYSRKGCYSVRLFSLESRTRLRMQNRDELFVHNSIVAYFTFIFAFSVFSRHFYLVINIVCVLFIIHSIAYFLCCCLFFIVLIFNGSLKFHQGDMASCNYTFLYLLVFRFLSPIFNTYGYNNDRVYTFVNEKCQNQNIK